MENEDLDEKMLDIENTMNTMKKAEEVGQERKKILIDFTDGVAFEGIKQGKIDILENKLEFEQKYFFNKKIQTFIPKNFKILDETAAKFKYPSESRPKLILSNKDGTINQTFNPTTNVVSDSQIGDFKDAMKEILLKLQPGARLIDDGVENINNSNIGYIEFISPAIDMRIRNLAYIVSLDGHALMCTINYPNKDREIWSHISKGLMKTLLICSRNTEED